MPAPLTGTSTGYRLVRITALVLGSLIFLYACERSRSSMLSDVWGELLLAAGLGVAGIAAAWFEISLSNRAEELETDEADETGQSGEFLLQSENRTIRARIAPSGNLVFHGRESTDGPESHEWSWTFRPDTFPAIKTALGGGPGELVELLESVVPQLDRPSRRDPGAWVRAHGIPATYREKGDNPSLATRKLPIIKRGLPREVQAGRAGVPVAAFIEQRHESAARWSAPTSGPRPRVTAEGGAPRVATPSRIGPRGRNETLADPSDDEDYEHENPPSLRERLGMARTLLARAIPGRRDDYDEDDLDDYDEEEDPVDDDIAAAADAAEDRFVRVADRSRGPRRADYDDYRDYDVDYEDVPRGRRARAADSARRPNRVAPRPNERDGRTPARSARAESAERTPHRTARATAAKGSAETRTPTGPQDRITGAKTIRGAREHSGSNGTHPDRVAADRTGRASAPGTGPDRAIGPRPERTGRPGSPDQAEPARRSDRAPAPARTKRTTDRAGVETSGRATPSARQDRSVADRRTPAPPTPVRGEVESPARGERAPSTSRRRLVDDIAGRTPGRAHEEDARRGRSSERGGPGANHPPSVPNRTVSRSPHSPDAGAYAPRSRDGAARDRAAPSHPVGDFANPSSGGRRPTGSTPRARDVDPADSGRHGGRPHGGDDGDRAAPRRSAPAVDGRAGADPRNGRSTPDPLVSGPRSARPRHGFDDDDDYDREARRDHRTRPRHGR
ncbi:hypothetical protein [Nocardia arizonensis]|uniref:hypothetical protein n=1 Tax=Nocardia arizonensis TaxID=1141647 RepID=UPI000ABF5C27|nr:hypothetical protein [Nocardia arizonensis]